MSGNARDADNVIPKLSDEGEDAESTIAMETPGFTSDGPPPLPVSEPPPALGASAVPVPVRPAAGAPIAASAVQKVDPGRVSASTQKAPVAMPPRPNLGVGPARPTPAPAPPQDKPVPSSANAVTVPKPTEKAPSTIGLPNLDDGPHDPDDVETKAVSREAMLAAEPHFVVRGEEEAGGDDATVALPPSENKGAVAANIAAAIGETLKSRIEPEGVPTGAPGFPAAGRPPAWGPEPTPFPSSNPMHASSNPMQVGVGPASPMAHPVGRPLSGAMPVAPHGQQPHPGMGMHPHQQVIAPAMPGPMGYPNPNAQTAPALPAPQLGPQGWAGGPSHVPMQGYPPPQQAGDPGRARPKGPPRLSGQMIVLIAVGVVCITIFITGVVLFVTTKF